MEYNVVYADFYRLIKHIIGVHADLRQSTIKVLYRIFPDVLRRF